MSQTAGGSWQCYSCGYIQLSAAAPAPPVPADVPCPRCDGPLRDGQDGIVRCAQTRCTYELDRDAFALFCQLVAEWDADPETFLTRVKARTEELRAREPYWLRTPEPV
ncbi:hypothetical protein [Streptomyces thermolilacinus]|uniref:hypothetical protein n=1 Tax=Streptomyces thermolilacinus TaxID=285540 RepID=UPI0033C377F3